jgi:ABC-2 type transport system ATP-binding protein
MTAAIDIDELTKTFGSTVALDRLTMRVETGQIHGFLGPNGAGKSTTIRVLLGLLRATSGTAVLLGGNPWRDAADLHRRLAYVPGDVNLWPNLTGGEAIDIIGRARGGLSTRRRDDLIERFDLDPRKKARAYSKGNRQKVSLIAALASDVELLLLDEPTSGLDPLLERAFTDYLRTERDDGCTVLLSSHILSEVEALCDVVSIIRAGRIVQTGTLDDLRHLHQTVVTAELADPALVSSLPGVTPQTAGGGRATWQVTDDAMPAVLGVLAREQARGVTATPPSLEELFLAQYADASSEGATA